ncbi:MAG: glycoside hydrolase family 9 protein [Cytophagaceae bacterium]|jgi:endoglucanase|nr:glycoside hydrolase family 9 protein [Cytophagaceae bacterium]
MKKRLMSWNTLLLLMAWMVYTPVFAQDGITENFDDNVLTGWMGGAYYTLAETNQNLSVGAVTTLGSYRVFSKTFNAIDVTNYPFIKVDVRSAAAFNLRIDLTDVNGKSTNGQAFTIAIAGDNQWHTYTFGYAGRFTQSWPAADVVDPAAIDELAIFVNPGGSAFNSTFYMDNLLVGSATGITPPPTSIRHNQVGFYPNMEKKVVVVSAAASPFYVVSEDKQDTLYTGTLGNSNSWSASGESVRIANFSPFTTPGSYFVLIPNIGYSHPFQIKDQVMLGLAKGSLKSFYFQRCSSPIVAPYGSPWTRSLGHPDNNVLIHNSATSPYRATGSTIDGSGGWYDAGDFNKYVVNSGIATHEMLATYEYYKTMLDTLDANIPESGNQVPDILDEIRWQMKWLLKMQDPYDGGVYFKLTSPFFDGTIMPSASVQARYVLRKTTAASLDFAAVCAQAARVYKGYETEFPGFADSCINAAVKAWKWARRNPSIRYIQSQMANPAINTGEYGDANFSDEFHWAAMELYITTKVDSFYTLAGALPTLNVPGWGDVKTLAYISLTLHKKNLTSIADTVTIKNRLLSLANGLRSRSLNSAYQIPMTDSDFYWGSNGGAANQGVILLSVFEFTRDSSYLRAALSSLDYLLGRNATNFCFVTGFGNKSPVNIHHATSGADNVSDPIPGLLAGGPNTDAQTDCGAAVYPSSTFKALSYTDSYCSYSTNEVAINWNAPLTFLSMGMEAVLKGIKASAPNVTVSPTDIATIQEITEVIAPSDLARALVVYPNPSAGLVMVSSAIELDQIRLLNAQGMVLATLELTSNSASFDVSSLPAGLYYVQVERNGISYHQKLMVK